MYHVLCDTTIDLTAEEHLTYYNTQHTAANTAAHTEVHTAAHTVGHTVGHTAGRCFVLASASFFFKWSSQPWKDIVIFSTLTININISDLAGRKKRGFTPPSKRIANHQSCTKQHTTYNKTSLEGCIEIVEQGRFVMGIPKVS